MRYLLIFASLALALEIEAQQTVEEVMAPVIELLDPIRQSCMQMSDVDPIYVEQFENSGKMIPDKNFKCFIRCFGSRYGMINKNGFLDAEVMQKQLKGKDSPQWDRVKTVCTIPMSKIPCQGAYLAAECVFKSILPEDS